MSLAADAMLARAQALIAESVRLIAAGKADTAAELRRRLTRNDPALFALVYLTKHVTDYDTGKVSLSDVHLAWAEGALSWAEPTTEPRADRRAEVAPREMGKSTWFFTLLPMWAAAHDHVRFAAAFADTDAQAQGHLATFKAELDSNRWIREDYPDLVEPRTRGRGTVMADRVSLYHAKSGFVFAAAGMDSSNLGMKVGDRRPDLIILDDIEPHEGRYSSALAAKRLATLREVIFPLNIRAHVIMVGTVTMQGSIVHNVVKRARGEYDDTLESEATTWVGEERITARHWLPIVTLEDGSRASVWPEKWPLGFLEEIEHTPGYAKNYANDPLGADGDYWSLEDFRRLPFTAGLAAALTHEVVSIDPAVTTKESSDFTGITAVGWASPKLSVAPHAGKCVVLESRSIKAGADGIRLAAIRLVEKAVTRGHAVIIIVEVNQGGELWERILHDMPCKVKVYTVSAPKPVRAADALDHYQRGKVAHAPGLRDTEGQLVAFPNAPHDDEVDSVGAGVRFFLSREKRRGPGVGAVSVPYA